MARRLPRWFPLLAVLAIVTGLAGAGAGKPVQAQEAASVTIKDFAFMPATITVAPGTTITWTNEDTAPHTATSGAPGATDAGAAFDSGRLDQGQSYSFTFTTPGTYDYFCTFHPFMLGTVVVEGGVTTAPPAAPAAPPAAMPAAPPTQKGETPAQQPAGMPQQPAGGPPGGPTAGPPPLPANATVVASGLVNPRGFAWGPDGALYVAEAGTPPAGFMPPMGPPQEGAPPVTNMNGSIVRIAPDGTKTTIVDGLPVVVGPIGDTVGSAGLAFVGDNLYAIISAGPVHGHPDFPGGVYQVGMDGTLTLVANTDAFNLANPPAFIPPDDEISNPYDMVALNGKLYITDGNRSVIWEVDPSDGSIRYLVDMSVGHPVLTGIAAGPDGNLYVTNLTSEPFPTGGANVWKVALDGTVTQVATGLTAATGIAVAPDGTIYVAEIAQSVGPPAFLAPPGRIVMIAPDGSIQTVAAPMMFPTILRWGSDGLYSTYFSVGGNTGEGAILKIDTSATP